jgi:hypothetical protein
MAALAIATPCILPAGAAADSSGAVTGTVAVPAAPTPCITIDNTSVDFGSLGLSPNSTQTVAGDANPATTVTNCSGSTIQQLYAHGSDAVGSGTGLWSLVASGAPCSAGPDKYRYSLRPVGAATSSATYMTNTDAFLSSAFSSSLAFTHRIYMPCTGSSGAGETMTTNVTFTVTF